MESDKARAIRELEEATRHLAAVEKKVAEELKVAQDEYRQALAAFHKAVVEEQ